MSKVCIAELKGAATRIRSRGGTVTFSTLANEVGMASGDLRNPVMHVRGLRDELHIQPGPPTSDHEERYQAAASRLAEKCQLVTIRTLAREMKMSPGSVRNSLNRNPTRRGALGVVSLVEENRLMRAGRYSAALYKMRSEGEALTYSNLSQRVGVYVRTVSRDFRTSPYLQCLHSTLVAADT